MHTPSVKSYTPASLLYVATSDGHRLYGSVNIYPVPRTDTHPVPHFFCNFLIRGRNGSVPSAPQGICQHETYDKKTDCGDTPRRDCDGFTFRRGVELVVL